MATETDLVRKISALLAKAEGTDNEHEASAFYAKAMDLMLRNSIDEQRVREAIGSKRAGEKPVKQDFMYTPNATYRPAKATLLVTVAHAAGVKVFFYPAGSGQYRANGDPKLKNSAWAVFVGFASDIETAKVLYASLLIQDARFARTDWRATGRTDDSWGFMQSHLTSFAHSVGRRFLETKGQVPTDGMALVVSRDTAVKDAVEDLIGPVGRGRQSRTKYDGQGWGAGHAAASRADLGTGHVTGGAKQIGTGR
jgi:hypothetical protein